MNNIVNIPIGIHCYVASSLRDVGLRTCSYPFDWVYWVENKVKWMLAVLDLDTPEKIKDFCIKFFDPKNKPNWIKEWHVDFPHDKPEDITEKYIRRITRLHQDLKTAKRVNLFFAVRWEDLDKTLLEIFFKFEKLNPNLHLYTINAFRQFIPVMLENKITPLYFRYTEQNVPWISSTERDWSYDHKYYINFLRTAYTEIKFYNSQISVDCKNLK